jgi:hypothetical protein
VEETRIDSSQLADATPVAEQSEEEEEENTAASPQRKKVLASWVIYTFGTDRAFK